MVIIANGRQKRASEFMIYSVLPPPPILVGLYLLRPPNARDMFYTVTCYITIYKLTLVGGGVVKNTAGGGGKQNRSRIPIGRALSDVLRSQNEKK